MNERVAIFLRHGDYEQLPDTPSAHQPFPLTERGRAQAREAAQLIRDMLEEHGWSWHPVIHTSSLQRAWETASLVAKELGEWQMCEIIETDELAERGLGGAANLSIATIERIIDEDPRHPKLPSGWKSESRFRLPVTGAESLVQAGERVAGYVESALAQLPQPDDDNRVTAVLFVGHGAAFRHSAYRFGVLAFDELAILSMYHAVPVALSLPPTGEWRQAAGEWKPRPRNEQPLD